jgi:hypothetical protein
MHTKLLATAAAAALLAAAPAHAEGRYIGAFGGVNSGTRRSAPPISAAATT